MITNNSKAIDSNMLPLESRDIKKQLKKSCKIKTSSIKVCHRNRAAYDKRQEDIEKGTYTCLSDFSVDL